MHVEDHPLEYGSFEGEIPKGSVRRGHGRDLGSRHVRAARGEARRRPDRPAAREAVPGRLDARARPSRRQGAELAPDPEAATTRPKRGSGRPQPYRPMLATLAERAAAGRRVALRGEVRRLPRARVRPRRRVRAALARRQRPDHALRGGRDGDREGGRAARGGRSTARSARSTTTGGRASRRCSRAPGRSSTTPSTCSSSTASRWSTCSLDASGGSGCAALLDARAAGRCGSPRASRTARRCFEAVAAQRLEGVVAKRRGSRYAAGPPDARLAEDQGDRPPGVRDRRLHARLRARAAHLRLARPRGERRRRASLRRQRRHRVRRRRRSGGCSRCCKPLERHDPPFREAPKMPRVRRGDVTWVEPRLVAEVAFSEWTHDGHVRQPSYKGLRDDKPAAEVRHERPPRRDDPARQRASSSSATSTSSSGPMRGSPRATCSTTTGRWRPCSSLTCAGRPFTMRRYPDGAYGKAFFQKDAPSHMPEWIRALPHGRLDARRASEQEIELPGRRRRARAALDGQHGLHRHEPVVLAGRQARPPGLRPLRPRSDARGAVGADDRGGAAPEGPPRRPRPRLVPEDLRRQGLPRPRPDRRGARPTTTRGASPSTIAGTIAARLPEARDDRNGRSRSGGAS